MIGKRFTAIGLLTLCGFLLGVTVNFVYVKGLPILAEAFPELLALLGGTWLLWGLIGALVSVTLFMLYAYLPENSTQKVLVSAVVVLALLDVLWIILLYAR